MSASGLPRGFRWPGSTERTPSMTFCMIGKNARIAAMITFEVTPKPKRITKIGMSATLGTTCSATMIGLSASSSQ